MTIRFLLALAGCGVLATPAAAQFGSISKGLSVAKKANDAVYTEAEKQQLGAEVSANIRKQFGVVQDAAVHRYVTLVGAVLARVSKKPDYRGASSCSTPTPSTPSPRPAATSTSPRAAWR